MIYLRHSSQDFSQPHDHPLNRILLLGESNRATSAYYPSSSENKLSSPVYSQKEIPAEGEPLKFLIECHHKFQFLGVKDDIKHKQLIRILTSKPRQCRVRPIKTQKKKRKKIRTNNKKLNDEQTNETTSQDKKTIFYPRTERKGSLTTQPSTQAINGRQFMKCVLHLSITRSGTMQKKKKKKEQQRRLLTYQENGQKRRPDRETDRPKKIRRPAGW